MLASGWLAQGAEVAAFENEICAFLDLPEHHAVGVSSGTAALFLALQVLMATGRRVACPVYACSALTNAIALAGARPLLLDTERDSPNIDLAALSRSDADIAVVPHMFGCPVAMSPLPAMPVIEDCAQSIGACTQDRAVGLSGLVGIFSFSATKLITSGGQGGMLVSRDRGLAEAARDYREFDGKRDRRPRFNLQMTDLQAAVGRAQLRKLPSFLERRRRIFERYRDAGLELVDPPVAGVAVRYRTVIRSRDPQRQIAGLARRQIAAIVPVHDWELLGPADEFPNASEICRTTVSLPTYPLLDDAQLATVIDGLSDVA